MLRIENRGGVVRVFPVVLPSGERYWTVLDEHLAVVEVADAFLRRVRFGRDQAELTTDMERFSFFLGGNGGEHLLA